MKIALSGYYGFDNAGDEALLSAITKTIKSLEPSASFVVLSGYPGKTARLHHLRAVNRMNPWSVTRELRQSSLLISGGGSLFQDITGPFSLPYYISIVALAKLLGKPVIFYAQGVGPIRRSFSKFLMRLIANRVDMITLRDEDSRLLLQEIGVTRPPIRVTADPVFTLEPTPQDQFRMGELLSACCPSGRPVVGVAVREWKALQAMRPRLARLLDLVVEAGYEVLFIPLDYPRDVEESECIAALMQQPSALVRQELTSLEHLALISRLRLMVGMRLHALIFAASQEVLFLGISYDPKIDSFLKMYDTPPLQGEATEMFAQVQELLNQGSAQDAMQTRSRELREKAVQTAHLALSLCQ